MATEKSEADLQTEIDVLLADNVGGDISAADTRTVVENQLVQQGSGGIYFQDFTNTIAVPVADTVTKLVGFTSNSSEGDLAVAADQANDRLVIGVDGRFLLNGGLTAEGLGNNVKYIFGFLINGTAYGLGASGARVSSDDLISPSMSVHVTLLAGATVELYGVRDSGSTSIDVGSLKLSAVRYR